VSVFFHVTVSSARITTAAGEKPLAELALDLGNPLSVRDN
jgi:hypothetical protein